MAELDNAVILPVTFAVNESKLIADSSKAVRNAEASLRPIKIPSADLTGLNRSLTGAKRQFNQLTEASVDFGDSLERGLRRIAALSIASAALFGIVRAFRESLVAARELEKALTDVNVVLNLPSDQLKEFGRSLFNVARNTKQTFDEVSKAALEFSRQGLTVEETLKRTEAALILVNLAGIDSVKATETITAAINSFSKENLKAIDIVSKLVAVDQNFAVSSADLAEAITRVGSVSSDVGVDFNRLISVVTAAQQVTQRGGAVIGNALKTIFQRIQRPETLESLERLGVQVREVDKETGKYTGNLLSADQVLRQVAERYKTLNQEQKAQTTQLLAGSLQGNIFRGVLAGLSIEQQAYNTALKSSDEAVKRNAALLGTQDAKLKSLGNTFKELGANVGKVGFGDFIDKSLNGLTGQGEGGIGSSLIKIITDSLTGTGKGTGGEIGNEFGRVFIKGFSDIILGPGLATVAVIGLKLASQFSKFTKDSLKQLVPSGGSSKADLIAQEQINKFLTQQSSKILEITQTTSNKVIQEQKILELFRQQNALLAQQASIRGVATSVVSREFAGRGIPSSTRRVPNAANGLVDAFQREEDAILKGVGGATSKAKPVFIEDFNGDVRGAVANTDELLVKNYKGNGKDAIFNRDMIQKYGIPLGAKPITAASGYTDVNNYPLGFIGTNIGNDYGFPSRPKFKPKIVKAIQTVIDGRTPEEKTQIIKTVVNSQKKFGASDITEEDLFRLLDTGTFAKGFVDNFAGGSRRGLGEVLLNAAILRKKKPTAGFADFLASSTESEFNRAYNATLLPPEKVYGPGVTAAEREIHTLSKKLFKDFKPARFAFAHGVIPNAAGGFVVIDSKTGRPVVRDGRNRAKKDSSDVRDASVAISTLGEPEVIKLLKEQGKISVSNLLKTAIRLKSENGEGAPTQIGTIPTVKIEPPPPVPLATRTFGKIDTSPSAQTTPLNIPTNAQIPRIPRGEVRVKSDELTGLLTAAKGGQIPEVTIPKLPAKNLPPEEAQRALNDLKLTTSRSQTPEVTIPKPTVPANRISAASILAYREIEQLRFIKAGTQAQLIPDNGLTPPGRLRPSLSQVQSVQNDIIYPTAKIPKLSPENNPIFREQQSTLFDSQIKSEITKSTKAFGVEILSNNDTLIDLNDKSKRLSAAFSEGLITEKQFNASKGSLIKAYAAEHIQIQKNIELSKTQAGRTEFQQLQSSSALSPANKKTLEGLAGKDVNDADSLKTVASITSSTQLDQRRFDRIAEIDAKIDENVRRRAESFITPQTNKRLIALNQRSEKLTSAFVNPFLKLEKFALKNNLGISEARLNKIGNIGGTAAFAAPFAIEAASSFATRNEQDPITKARQQRGFSTFGQAASTAGLIASVAPVLGPVGGAAALVGSAAVLGIGAFKGATEGSRDSAEDTAKRALDDANSSVQRLQTFQSSQADILRLQSLREEKASPEVIRGFLKDALNNANNVSSPVFSSQIKNLLLKPNINETDIKDLFKSKEKQDFLEDKRRTLSPASVTDAFNNALKDFKTPESGVSAEILNRFRRVEVLGATNPENSKETAENLGVRIEKLNSINSILEKTNNFKSPQANFGQDFLNPTNPGSQLVTDRLAALEQRKQVANQISSVLTKEQRAGSQQLLEDIASDDLTKANAALGVFKTVLKSLPAALQEDIEAIGKRQIADDEYKAALNLSLIVQKKRTEAEINSLKREGRQEVRGIERADTQQTQSRLGQLNNLSEGQIKFNQFDFQSKELEIQTKERSQSLAEASAGDVIQKLIANSSEIKTVAGVDEEGFIKIVDSLDKVTGLGEVNGIIDGLVKSFEAAGKGTSEFVKVLGKLSEQNQKTNQQFINTSVSEGRRLELAKKQEATIGRSGGVSSGITEITALQKKSRLAPVGSVPLNIDEELQQAEQRRDLFNKAIGTARDANLAVPQSILDRQDELNNKVLEKKIKVSERDLRESDVGELPSGTEILDLLRQSNNAQKGQLEIQQNKGIIDAIKAIALKKGQNISEDKALDISRGLTSRRDIKFDDAHARIFGSTLDENGETNFRAQPNNNFRGEVEAALPKPVEAAATARQNTLNFDLTNAKIPDINLTVPKFEVQVNVSADNEQIKTLISDIVQKHIGTFSETITNDISQIKLELTSTNDKFDFKVAEISKDTGTVTVPKSFKLSPAAQNDNL